MSSGYAKGYISAQDTAATPAATEPPQLTEPPPGEPISFLYKNYRGVAGRRTVTPIGVRFATSPYYPEPEWLLDAWCHGKNAVRSFVIRNINVMGRT